MSMASEAVRAVTYEPHEKPSVMVSAVEGGVGGAATATAMHGVRHVLNHTTSRHLKNVRNIMNRVAAPGNFARDVGRYTVAGTAVGAVKGLTETHVSKPHEPAAKHYVLRHAVAGSIVGAARKVVKDAVHGGGVNASTVGKALDGAVWGAAGGALTGHLLKRDHKNKTERR